ncbi:hypothetical protein [Parasphingorhabdus sp.]|uniref:hypothetical protein n=1 Tax=Parasphingorhabdus sp. TaxID=2709688 RepID=UPI003D26B19E
MTVFTWSNCWADIYASGNGRTLQAYLNDVLEPSISSLDDQITGWNNSSEPWAPFAKSDTENLFRETMKAFCLAVQSLWERQIRDYLRNCASELRPQEGFEIEAMSTRWHAVEKLFYTLRGISISSFPSYDHIYTLHLLGNVCRHGEGPSAKKLWERRPDLWPMKRLPMPGEKPPVGPPSAIQMIVSPDHLREFVGAIIEFWNDANYIYLESINRKEQTVIDELEKLRATRTWIPQ